jgi:excisionase family DNA binding protein
MTPGPAAPTLWTVREAAAYYRETERTIRQWIDKGALDVARKGGVVRIVAPPEARQA